LVTLKLQLANNYDKIIHIFSLNGVIMAAFQEHISVAVLSVGVVIIPFHTIGLLNVEQSLVALFFGILGGVAPDLDSDNSRPIQSVFRILSITLPLILLLSLKSTLSVFEILVIWILTGFVLKMVFFKIFLSLTKHRGIFHTIPMGILFGELVILLCSLSFHMQANLAFLYGFFMFLGFFVHLLLDEIYSVNVLGVRLKKSFGTALKLYDKNNKAGTLIVYVCISLLWFLLPSYGDLFSSMKEAFLSVTLF
jgi:hypothetical protein